LAILLRSHCTQSQQFVVFRLPRDFLSLAPRAHIRGMTFPPVSLASDPRLSTARAKAVATAVMFT
jgi:hypothetical protein